MQSNLRPAELLISEALSITKLTREALTGILKHSLSSTVAGRKLLNNRDFSMSDISRLKEALREH